jgi:hypothetical protein
MPGVQSEDGVRAAPVVTTAHSEDMKNGENVFSLLSFLFLKYRHRRGKGGGKCCVVGRIGCAHCHEDYGLMLRVAKNVSDVVSKC